MHHPRTCVSSDHAGLAKKLLLLSLIAMCTGCSNYLPVKLAERTPRPFVAMSPHEVTVNQKGDQGVDSPYFLGCYNTVYNHHANAPHKFLRGPTRTKDLRLAVLSYPFALMASNSYHTEVPFKIGLWKSVRHFRGRNLGASTVGFQADLYVNDGERRLALVFRGTDQIVDKPANYSFWLLGKGERAPFQYQIAEGLLNQLKNDEAYRGFAITLVGHSLGAGLALYAGWNHPDVEYFLFDPSPRSWRSGAPLSDKVHVIREEGEILTWLFFWKRIPVAPENVSEPDIISGGAVREHRMYFLARGLLLISAVEGEDANAKELMNANLACNYYEQAPDSLTNPAVGDQVDASDQGQPP